jgi:hypothetical protein
MPTKEEYEEMDRIRFPWAHKLDSDTVKKIWKSKAERKAIKTKAEQRVVDLINKNQDKFMCPIFDIEILPSKARKRRANVRRASFR